MEFLCERLQIPLEFLCANRQLSSRTFGLLPTRVESKSDCGSAHVNGATMLDFILLALGLGFFALSIAYAFGCDRL